MKYFSLHGFYIMLIFMLCSLTGNAQILNKPVPADNPNYAGHSVWAAACASEDFREYFVNITWSPPVVNSDNEFILELSDANGDFSSPTILATITDKNSDFDFDVGFEVPENTRGEGYTMRVRSTSPAITGPASDPYAMYFIGYKDPILISRDRSGTIPPGGEISACNGESIVLAAHNVPDYENYEYHWYKDGVLTTERSSEITIMEEGVYSVEIDYGVSCSGSANTLSNSINVIFVDPLNISITAQSSTSICNGQTVAIETNINDANLTYTWFKNGVAITTPTLGEYLYTVDASVADFDGDYYVTVQGQNTCVEQSNSITVTDAGVFEITLDQPTDIQLLPTQSSTLSVSTTATNPTFQWFRNGSIITGETTADLVVSQDGDYFVRVSQGGACSSSQVDSDTTTVAFPDSFSFTIGFVGSYVECSSTEANITISRIDAIYGANTVDVTSTIQNDFGYQWQIDGTDVPGETTLAILLIDPSENGTYSLNGTLGSYTAVSNELSVRIGSGEIVEITSTGTALCDGDSLTLETDRDLSAEIFEWQKDGVLFDNSSTQITVTETGSYQLVIQQNDCPLVSNTIEVLPFDDSAITIDVEPEFLYVSGTTITVTAEGATTYEWYNENNELVGTGETFDITQEGTYVLVASIDNCSGSRTFTAILRDEFEVPNVITPNGDGINDLWLLPNIYSGNSNVRVTIFSDSGEEIFRQTNYQNNWPESSMSFDRQNMIFYYTIKESGSTVKQGTITVIR